jgi:cell division transport system permease protein
MGFSTTFKRIIKSGFVNFWRNNFVSLSSILVMTLTLFVLGSIIFIGATLNAALEQIRSKVDVNVYFVTTAREDDILSIKTRLEEIPEVAEVEYVSRDAALERFRARHEDDQLTLQALEELGDNPLGANLNIRAKETSQYEGIAKFLENESALSTTGDDSIIDSINFFQNRVAIEKLTSIIDSAERFGLIVTIVLALATILITFNTIRLAIYTAREEISVMRLVGATNTYIRGPFVFEGIMYGFIAGITTLVLFYPFTLWLAPVTQNFFGDINVFNYYISNFVQMFFIIIGAGVVLGAISSYLAVRRYLKI